MALILVKTFSTPHEAHLYKAKLEIAGIQCFLHDENSVGLEMGYSIALGGIKLMIHEKDKDLALEILNREAEQISDTTPFKKNRFSFLGWLKRVFRI